MISKLKFIFSIFFALLGAAAFIFGLIVQFVPIEGSKDMSRMGVEWYQFTHYWYVWVVMVISVVGFQLTAKK